MHPHSYFLLNEKRSIDAGEKHNKIEENVFEFPDFRITSFDMIGNYECVIENENIQGEKVVSQKALSTDLKGKLATHIFTKYFHAHNKRKCNYFGRQTIKQL